MKPHQERVVNNPLPPCGDCDPCLGGRPDQCALFPKSELAPVTDRVSEVRRQVAEECRKAAAELTYLSTSATEGDYKSGRYGNWLHNAHTLKLAAQILETSNTKPTRSSGEGRG